MKVFISWSGDFSLAVAKILRKYLPVVNQRLTVFMSDRDMRLGKRWAEELAHELADGHFGILCLTPDNTGSAWLNFEAGAISRGHGASLCAILLDGLEAGRVPQPLAQFQNLVGGFTQGQIHRLFGQINGQLDDERLPDDLFQESFDTAWPQMEAEFTETAVRDARTTPPGPEPDRAERMLEEILAAVRGRKSGAEHGQTQEMFEEMLAAVRGTGVALAKQGMLSPDGGGPSLAATLTMDVDALANLAWNGSDLAAVEVFRRIRQGVVPRRAARCVDAHLLMQLQVKGLVCEKDIADWEWATKDRRRPIQREFATFITQRPPMPSAPAESSQTDFTNEEHDPQKGNA